jgi:hypothetical protein
VQNADIAVNDDALCMKAGRDSDGLRVARPTEDVVIRDVTVRDAAAGITFGSETSGGFRNIEAYRITVMKEVPVGILFKSAHTRGGFGENLRIHDLTMTGVPVVLRVTMNWNPSYSYAEIPADVASPPPYWKVLATPVPGERGKARMRDVHIWNIRASGATTAFEVEGYREAPLERFVLDHLDIQAGAGGHIHFAKDWRFASSKLVFSDGKPIEVSDDSTVSGLAPDQMVLRPARAKFDPAKRSFEEQDKG